MTPAEILTSGFMAISVIVGLVLHNNSMGREFGKLAGKLDMFVVEARDRMDRLEEKVDRTTQRGSL